jgi:hypothetical protein
MNDSKQITLLVFFVGGNVSQSLMVPQHLIIISTKLRLQLVVFPIRQEVLFHGRVERSLKHFPSFLADITRRSVLFDLPPDSIILLFGHEIACIRSLVFA